MDFSSWKGIFQNSYPTPAPWWILNNETQAGKCLTQWVRNLTLSLQNITINSLHLINVNPIIFPCLIGLSSQHFVLEIVMIYLRNIPFWSHLWVKRLTRQHFHSRQDYLTEQNICEKDLLQKCVLKLDSKEYTTVGGWCVLFLIWSRSVEVSIKV